MKIEDLILIARSDYLDDEVGGQLWNDDFMFRAFVEAERQACNRQNFLFDDDITFTLVNGKTSYKIPSRLTRLGKFIFESNVLGHLSKHEIERTDPAWRSREGMTGNVVQYVITSRKVRFIPSPAIDDDGLKVTLEAFRLPKKDIIDENYTPEIPEEYHRDLLWWVLHSAYKKQDADTFDQERSDYYLSRFTESFGEYIPAEVRNNQMEQASSLHLMPTRNTIKMTSSSSIDDAW